MPIWSVLLSPGRGFGFRCEAGADRCNPKGYCTHLHLLAWGVPISDLHQFAPSAPPLTAAFLKPPSWSTCSEGLRHQFSQSRLTAPSDRLGWCAQSPWNYRCRPVSASPRARLTLSATCRHTIGQEFATPTTGLTAQPPWADGRSTVRILQTGRSQAGGACRHRMRAVRLQFDQPNRCCRP